MFTSSPALLNCFHLISLLPSSCWVLMHKWILYFVLLFLTIWSFVQEAKACPLLPCRKWASSSIGWCICGSPWNGSVFWGKSLTGKCCQRDLQIELENLHGGGHLNNQLCWSLRMCLSVKPFKWHRPLKAFSVLHGKLHELGPCYTMSCMSLVGGCFEESGF